MHYLVVSIGRSGLQVRRFSDRTLAEWVCEARPLSRYTYLLEVDDEGDSSSERRTLADYVVRPILGALSKRAQDGGGWR